MAPSARSGYASGGKPQNGQRMKKYLRPDGRSVLIAPSPSKLEELRSSLPLKDQEGEFDVYIHGSPEHLDAVREIHAHHEKTRQRLREEHANVYDEFETVHAELDALSKELHSLTEHGVTLDANFSKFGYSAHLRTHDSDSRTNSVHGDHSAPHGEHDWESERRRGQAMKFWKRPVVRQYFHKGLLWRASEVEEVASFELFVDLLYVGIIAINGDKAAEDPTGAALLRFSITFILSWKLWSDLTTVVSWFETDDIVQRMCILLCMVCLFGYTTNISASFDTTYTQLIAFYLTQRLFGAAYYLWIAYLIPMIRSIMICHAMLVVIPSSLWIASIHVPEPQRLALIWIAIVLDLFGSTTLIFIVRAPGWLRKVIGGWIEKNFDSYPAVNIEHKTQRTNAFVGLVFGYSVVALLYQNRSPFGLNAFFGKAILGVIQAFCFNWLYFEIDSFNLHYHAIRRHYVSSLVWISVHLPFVMSFLLAAAALSRIVVAHDRNEADLESLSEAYIGRSIGEISPGVRWFYSTGLGIALACMGVISMCHVHKEVEGIRIRKRHRLAVRFAVAICLICLPLADRLDSLQLVSTTTGLIVLVLITDLLGSTCINESFWRDERTCSYSAECRLRRKDVEDAAKSGQVVHVQELAKQGEGGEKGFYELS